MRTKEKMESSFPRKKRKSKVIAIILVVVAVIMAVTIFRDILINFITDFLRDQFRIPPGGLPKGDLL